MSSIHPSHSSPASEGHNSVSEPASSINNPFEQTTSIDNTFEKTTSHEKPSESATSRENPSESLDNNNKMGTITSKLVPDISDIIDEEVRNFKRSKNKKTVKFEDTPDLGELQIPDRDRFPRRKSKAQKARDLKNAVEEDYDDNWLTESGSDGETSGDGKKLGSSKAHRAASRRRLAALNARQRIFKDDLKERKNMPVLPEEENRFIDRSFRHGLQDSIKGWKDVRFFTTKETASDLRLDHAFSGPRGPPRGSRTEYQGPLTTYRDLPRRACKPHAATWPEIKELLQKRGMDTKEFEERGREEEERLIQLLRLHEEGRRAKCAGAKYDDFGDELGDSDEDDDHDVEHHSGESSDEEEAGEIPPPVMTGWDYVNPLNWSLDLVPEWVQDFFIWAQQAEHLYDDDTDWCQIIFMMVIFWLGGLFTLLIVWVMSRAMMATGQWRMDEPGHPVPI
ncbi:hypothetical protein TWF594_005712 [Orbilia oligospora]|nr:hypothetical protein TWF706_004262 [Orbilia oligospora]KAF3151955.1 hypothetical protein TWF594_005712 [Orbilia oligospora]